MTWRWLTLVAMVALLVVACEEEAAPLLPTPTPTQTAHTPEATPVPSPTSTARTPEVAAFSSPTPSRAPVKECPIPSVGHGMTLDEVRRKYNALFWRQPNVQRVRMDTVRDENGRSRGLGIIISVTEKVDQSTLPVEDLIPDCIKGIPVEIRAEKWEVSG